MTNTATDSTAQVHTKQSDSLWSPSYLGLLSTQFLTAVNDNVFRWLVVGIGRDYVRPDQMGFVLSAGIICFVIPYLVLAAPAGYLADRFDKSQVIFWCKVAEIAVMLLGVVAIFSGQLWFLFVVVSLTGAQSALFSPAKLGSIPEILTAKKIPTANGLFGLSTITATVIGMALGGYLKEASGYQGLENLWVSAATLLGIAVVGTICSLAIRRLSIANASRRFPWNAPVQTCKDLYSLAHSRALIRVALGIAFFWAVGALAQLNIDQFSQESGGVLETHRTPFLVSLVLGVGLGSVLAGLLSRGRVELGLLPLGAGGIILGAVLLFTVQETLFVPVQASAQTSVAETDAAVANTSSTDPDVAADSEAGVVRQIAPALIWACVLLFGLGVSAGMFDVPLESYMQHNSPRESRGSILAATNFLTFFGMLISAVIYYGLQAIGLSSREIFLIVGLATIPVLLYVLWLIPQTSIRFLVWLASQTIYRIRIRGKENLPERGGALLVVNHVTWIDGALLLLTSSRPVRLVAWAGNFKSRWFQRLAESWGVILISSGPKSIRKGLATAREALLNGELVGVFPEGGLTHSGQIQGFKPGMLKILEGTSAPVIPVYLDELWGSIFSYDRERFFWKIPKRFPYPISIHFGKPITAPKDVHQIRRAVQDLGAAAVESRSQQITNLPSAFIRSCKKRKRKSKASDSTGADLTGGTLLMRCLILRRLLLRHVLKDDEQYVGVLLPPSIGGLATNMALALDRRIAVNLNYTLSSDGMNHCINMCGIKHVLTSRKVMDKMQFDLDAEVIYLEDFREVPEQGPTTQDKVVAAYQAYAMSAKGLIKQLHLDEILGDDTLTVIFTSGSTGMPKGVMLTHSNVAHNVEAIDQVVHLNPRDVLVGILPFFHSLGYTVTMWGSMALDIKGCYHFSPLDGKQVGKLCQKNQGTLLLATPTFLRTYLRRCDKEQLASLDVIVTGAERLPEELGDAFEEKFGIRPVEGYGTTELSPLVSVNVPPSRKGDNFQVDNKLGTVGRPVSGVSARITDLDTGEELGAGQAGMLWIKGPNVMKGYLDRQDLTDEVVQDGWYKTGDVALIDDDGFIKITGRESRFSKIGGEMVPHIQVEETLARIIGADEEDGLQAAVTAVPDPKKGERLVVLHRGIEKTTDDLRKGLTEAGLPNIFIPSADSFIEIDELPILGTGKLDLKGLKQIAEEQFAPAPDEGAAT